MSDSQNKQVLIIKGRYRFKIKTSYHNNLINFFKTLSGRFYDQQTHEWSFPAQKLLEVKEFLENSNFNFKEIDVENFARLFKNDKEILMSFDGYQESFEIFNQIEGAHYDRDMGRYIVPLEKLSQLEAILISNKYNYLLYEDKISSLIFPSQIIELRPPLSQNLFDTEEPVIEPNDDSFSDL